MAAATGAPKMSLMTVLEDSKLREEFKDFVELRGGLENLLFYENIVMYEGISEQEFRNHTARKIITYFIMDDSQYMVNIKADQKNYLLDLFEANKDFAPESFELCKREVLVLMDSNYLHAFLRHHSGEEVNTQNFPIKYKVTPGTFRRIAQMLRGAYKLKQKNWNLPIREPSDGEGSSDSFRG